MAQLDKTFPTLDCAACILTPKMVDAAQNEKINIYLLQRGGRGQGLRGQFHGEDPAKRRATSTKTKCTGCGVCTEKCPSQTKVPERVQHGPQHPPAPSIFPLRRRFPTWRSSMRTYCMTLQDGQVRPVRRRSATAGRDRLTTSRTRYIERQYGAIIVVATGFKPIDAGQVRRVCLRPEPGCGDLPRVRAA